MLFLIQIIIFYVLPLFWWFYLHWPLYKIILSFFRTFFPFHFFCLFIFLFVVLSQFSPSFSPNLSLVNLSPLPPLSYLFSLLLLPFQSLFSLLPFFPLIPLVKFDLYLQLGLRYRGFLMYRTYTQIYLWIYVYASICYLANVVLHN